MQRWRVQNSAPEESLQAVQAARCIEKHLNGWPGRLLRQAEGRSALVDRQEVMLDREAENGHGGAVDATVFLSAALVRSIVAL